MVQGFLPKVDKVSQRKDHTTDLSFLKLFSNHLLLTTVGNRTQSEVNILTKSLDRRTPLLSAPSLN